MERTVEECKKTIPKILAVVNAFGDYSNNIHSVKFIVPKLEGRIIYERLYHFTLQDYGRLDGLDYGRNNLVGKNVHVFNKY